MVSLYLCDHTSYSNRLRKCGHINTSVCQQTSDKVDIHTATGTVQGTLDATFPFIRATGGYDDI